MAADPQDAPAARDRPELKVVHSRPMIEVRAGELPRLVREAESALIAVSGIYQRAGQLVRIVRLDETIEQRGVWRAAGSTIIAPLSKDFLTLSLARSADWTRWDNRTRAQRPTDPPPLVASALMSASGEWRLPALSGLITAPTLRGDGTLLDAPGYDARSGLYGAFESRHFPRIDPRPSREDALAALAQLRDLFRECAFAGGADTAHASVAIAGTIAAVVRHALGTAPAIAFSAYKRASGKTTTAKAIAQVATGSDPPVLTWPDEETELKKALLGILIAGDTCVLVDNVSKPLDSATLCAILTSASYTDRVLGGNQRVIVPTSTSWLLTGNHLEVVGDLTSRTLLSVLDPELENPEAREFERDMAAYIAEHRGALLHAALTIPLAYLAAGEPCLRAERSRFTEWDHLVRRPLLWLDVADPLASQQDLQAADPVREGLVAVLRAWHTAFGDEPTTVARATEAALELNHESRPDLYEALHGVAGEKAGISGRRLGRYLKRSARRIEEGLRVEIAEPDRVTHRQRFRVANVAGVSGVSGVSPNVSWRNDSLGKGNRTDAGNAGNAGRTEEADEDIPF